MASNGSSYPKVGETENSLEKIKRQLTSGSGRSLLQGPLLKRSETVNFPKQSIRIWSILELGEMSQLSREPLYLMQIALLRYPLLTSNIGTPQKKEYFLCAETPGAARAWVSTLQKNFTNGLKRLTCLQKPLPLPTPNESLMRFISHYIVFLFSTSATQLVLRAHKEAVNSLSGNGSAKLGTVATVVAAANSTALESSKEIEAAMRISMRTALGMVASRTNDGPMDDMTIMKLDLRELTRTTIACGEMAAASTGGGCSDSDRDRSAKAVELKKREGRREERGREELKTKKTQETLRVKDEELQQLARDIRTRDSTIKEMAEKLSNTADAAEAAASAVHSIDEQRRIACGEIERLTIDSKKQLESSMLKLRESENLILHLNRQRDEILKQRDSAVQETHLWRSELAKARERVVILEGATVRAEERARVAEADVEAKVKRAAENELAAAKEKEKLLAYVEVLQTQVQRQQRDTQHVFEEKIQSCSDDASNNPPLTKHVNLSDDNVDKACLSISTRSSQLAIDRDNPRSIRNNDDDGEWSDIPATDGVIADVWEITPEAEGSSLDIPVVSSAVEGSSFHQP
ncbi:hypothetical protein GIB67_017154 [Kingdonia uniflora]|uniref:PH domain-containing protein n=1 Tax=Kingdonia uniflora TaxID=39325 RepID=A0A7J7M652_9MAGN|nr:hypothetical protein GIB67_017154 [Kingdonia uniflora]